MQAFVQRSYGSASVLHWTQIDTPAVGEHDVLVHVHAAGLDRGTWHLMTGKPYLLRLLFGLRAPKQAVPGHDVAGTVTAVGSAVTKFVVGDHVFGFGHGTFAEYSVAREDKLAGMPASISFEQAAAVGVSAGTAHLAARRGARGHASPGGRPGPRQGHPHHGAAAMIRLESTTTRHPAFAPSPPGSRPWDQRQ